MHLSVDGNECKGGRAVFVGSRVDGGKDPMVGVFDEHADSKDGETYGVGINSSNFSKPYVVRGEGYVGPRHRADEGYVEMDGMEFEGGGIAVATF